MRIGGGRTSAFPERARRGAARKRPCPLAACLVLCLIATCAVAAPPESPLESPLYDCASAHARAQSLLQTRRGRLWAAFFHRSVPPSAQAEAPESSNPDAPKADQDRTKGNYVYIVDDAYEALLLRIHLIRSAQHAIDIQTFILANDECGRLITYELIQAAKRGVRVRIIADHYMSERDPEWIAFLATAHPNLSIKYYRPPGDLLEPCKLREIVNGLLFFRGSNQRMHNKVIIVDDLLALVGGRNIDNHYYNHSTTYNFLDRDALVFGPILPEVRESFDEFWDFRRSVPSGKLRDVARTIRHGSFDRPEARADFQFNGFFDKVDQEANDPDVIQRRIVDRFTQAEKLEFIWDEPGKNHGRLWIWGGGRTTRRLRRLVKQTEEELVLQSPYLILNTRSRHPFRRLRKKHPDARIIVCTNSLAATDNTLAYSANFKLRSTYVERLGFHIYELKPHPADLVELFPNFADLQDRAEKAGTRTPFLSVHAKSFVSDGRIAYVGSYNVDPRSDNLNTEVGFIIHDETIAQAVRATILSRIRPESSWVIAKKKVPLNEINYLIVALSGITPIDLWPLRYTSCFDLIPGKEPLPPDHPDFYDHYADVGISPEVQALSPKELTTQLYKMLNTLAIPVL